MMTCEPCQNQGIKVEASHFCYHCDEKYCDECCYRHKAHSRTKMHEIFYLGTFEPVKHKCASCAYSEDDKAAFFHCTDCNDYLCLNCQKYHKYQKQTREHHVSQICNFLTCYSCLSIGQQISAKTYCKDCEDELLCEPCSKRHLSSKTSKGHKLSKDMSKYKLR